MVITLGRGFTRVVAPPKLKLIHVPIHRTSVDRRDNLDTGQIAEVGIELDKRELAIDKPGARRLSDCLEGRTCGASRDVAVEGYNTVRRPRILATEIHRECINPVRALSGSRPSSKLAKELQTSIWGPIHIDVLVRTVHCKLFSRDWRKRIARRRYVSEMVLLIQLAVWIEDWRNICVVGVIANREVR